jgi:hypothetical protein
MDKIKMPMLPETTLNYVKKILEPHGVKIEVHEQPEEGDRFPCWLLLLPEGTRKEREGFTGAYHEHNKITLPDGFVFFQEVDAQSWSTISFPIEEKKTHE